MARAVLPGHGRARPRGRSSMCLGQRPDVLRQPRLQRRQGRPVQPHQPHRGRVRAAMASAPTPSAPARSAPRSEPGRAGSRATRSLREARPLVSGRPRRHARGHRRRHRLPRRATRRPSSTAPTWWSTAASPRGWGRWRASSRPDPALEDPCPPPAPSLPVLAVAGLALAAGTAHGRAAGSSCPSKAGSRCAIVYDTGQGWLLLDASDPKLQNVRVDPRRTSWTPRARTSRSSTAAAAPARWSGSNISTNNRSAATRPAARASVSYFSVAFRGIFDPIAGFRSNMTPKFPRRRGWLTAPSSR